ncbi:HET domain containing protein [Hyaloscypha variabilis]
MSHLTPPAKVLVSKERCFCKQLHQYCDPASCSEAWDGAAPPHFYVPWVKLVDSAIAGCHTCQILRQSVEMFEELPSKADELLKAMHKSVKIRRVPRSVMLTPQSWYGTNNDGTYEEGFEICQVSPSGCDAFPEGSFKNLATGDSSSFEQCREWIQDCRKTHKACQAEVHLLPRRVIDISHIEGEEFSPRLYETHNEIGDYSALSHCWGPAATSVLTTTIETYQDRLLGIRWDLLCRTFREGIIITHKLGLRYIWIDSLCIIQDDILDWQSESKQMGSIYSYSNFTIAALKSEDGNGGCFVDNEKIYLHPAGRPLIAVRRLPRHSAWEHYRTVEPHLPLFSRAWTLQEELLAPRVLYYGPDELVFQCRSVQACLCGKTPQNWGTTKYKYEIARLDSSSLEVVQQSWASIVQQYSSRFLTIRTDRLPAISGLAKAFENRGLGRYIAGIWTENLPIWLIWCRQDHGSIDSNNVYVAPSWSWASVAAGTQVFFHIFAMREYKPSDSRVEVLDAVVNPAGADHTGALHSGHLYLRGRVICADLWLTDVRRKRGEHRLRKGPWETEVALDVAPEFDRVLYPEKVHCLFLCSLVLDEPRGLVQFILILKEGDQPGEYKRRGIAIVEKGVQLTEDCECSSEYRPGLEFEREKDLRGNVRKCDAFEAWFKDVEEKEITLI